MVRILQSLLSLLLAVSFVAPLVATRPVPDLPSSLSEPEPTHKPTRLHADWLSRRDAVPAAAADVNAEPESAPVVKPHRPHMDWLSRREDAIAGDADAGAEPKAPHRARPPHMDWLSRELPSVPEAQADPAPAPALKPERLHVDWLQ